MSMRLLSLFSGCGGMDLGFEGDFKCLRKSVNPNLHSDWITGGDDNWVTLGRTMFETVFANDIRPDAKIAWVNYFSSRKKNAESVYCVDSIVNLVKRAKRGEFSFPDTIDVVTGGFPCQDFSLAGKRLGFDSKKSHLGIKLAIDEPSNESRGKLYMWMRDVITLTKPKVFIAENVKGLTNLNDAKEIIEHDFSSACDGGYLVVPARVLRAKDYGVPQARERVLFVGFNKSLLTPSARAELEKDEIAEAYDPYPQRTHGRGLMPYVTCRDAFKGLQEPERDRDEAQKHYSKAHYMGSHCQGQIEVDLEDVSPTIRSEHHGNIEYRRLSAEHGGRRTDELQAGMTERRLSVRECARLQTFPDEYEFVFKKAKGNSLSASNAYRIIGNAVPCLLAYHVARNLEKKWSLYFGLSK